MVTLMCPTALATDVNLSVTSGGSDMVIVEPCGGTVTYEVRGLLSDAQNGGLAGFLFGLSFDGGPLEAAEAPVADPMRRFAPPDGISGPGGFGSLVVDGRLVGVGGAQNTIKNTGDYAPSPIGAVVTGVGHAEVVLVTGSLTTPAEPGTYTLTLSNLRATVIKLGEDGSGVVWATEPAGVVTITNLTVIVSPVDPPASASNSGPACAGDDVTLFGSPDGMTSYLWTGPDGFTSTQQDPTISPARRGTYTLTVTDADNCTGVDRTTIDVLPAPCEPWMDCNNNSLHDDCDLALGTNEDCNGNDTLDECDISAGASLDCNATAVPDECETIGAGDFDGDGAIGLSDFQGFEDCAAGPEADPAPNVPECIFACRVVFDSDSDDDIDLRDFAALQSAFTGSPAPYTRVLVPHDSWIYSEQRNGTVNGEPVTAVGTQTIDILDDIVIDLAGGTARVMLATLDVVVNDETPVTILGRLYFSQDPDGTLYRHGEVDESVDPPIERFVQTPVEGKFRSLASPLIVGATAQWNITYDDGTTMVGESTVVAIESIVVPAGQFTAWRIEAAQTITAGTATTSYQSTNWFVPMIGSDVKVELDLTYIDDGTEVEARHVRELTETNVPY